MAFRDYEHNDLITGGSIKVCEMVMTPYPDQRRRRVLVWLPEDYDGIKRFPVVYMHDGQGLFRDGMPNAKQDVDIAMSSLKACGISAIIVGIDNSPTERGTEFTPPLPRGKAGIVINGRKVPIIEGNSTTDLYADFIIKDVKPVIDKSFMTYPDAEHTSVAGISAGGSTSYYMMLRDPDIFSRAIVCSPGFPMFDLEKMLEMLDVYDFSKLEGHRIAFYNGDTGLDKTSVDYVLAVYRKMLEKGMTGNQCMFLLDSRQTHCASAWAKYFPELFRFILAEDNSEPAD